MTKERPVVLFGNGAVAELVHFYLQNETQREVVAATIDRDRLQEPSRIGLPIVGFDEVVDRYPPDQYEMFIALGYGRMNGIRAARYDAAKALGYTLLSHVSPRASTWPDLDIGDNCLVMDNVVIQPFAKVGNDCILWSGSHIGHAATIADHCYIAAKATVSGFASVGECAFVGTGSIVRDGISVGARCLIGAGAVITSDTAPDSVHKAPPALVLAGQSDRLPSF